MRFRSMKSSEDVNWVVVRWMAERAEMKSDGVHSWVLEDLECGIDDETRMYVERTATSSQGIVGLWRPVTLRSRGTSEGFSMNDSASSSMLLDALMLLFMINGITAYFVFVDIGICPRDVRPRYSAHLHR